MTQGVDGQTLDRMSLPRINRIIESIRNRTYQPKPAKRKYIPRKMENSAHWGITSTDDKLVQEVVRMILEAIYEPTFSNYSHGFRPKRKLPYCAQSGEENLYRCHLGCGRRYQSLL